MTEDAEAVAEVEEELSQLSVAPSSSHYSIAEKKKKKKRKKKNTGSSSLSLQLLPNTSPLPSQKLIESVFPWKIVCKPRLGRCAVSTRDIKAGEKVISEQALSFVLRSTYRTAACHFCCKDLSEVVPGVQCEKCNYTMFCEECERIIRPVHKIYCEMISKIGRIAEEADCDGDLLRLVLSLYLRRANQQPTDGEAGSVQQGILHPSFQDAMGLQTHREKVSAAWRSSVRNGCEALCELLDNHVMNFNSTAGLQFQYIESNM